MARTSSAASKTTRTTAGKRLPSPLVLGRAHGDKLPGETPLKPMAKPTEIQLVNALTNAEGFHRDALLIELAVGLSLFATMTDGSKVDLPMKKALRHIYEKAGYNCRTPEGEDYKTVARRVGVTASLFTHIGGHETIRDWVEDAPATKHVQRIQEALAPKKFSYISDVLAYVGKPVVVKRPRLPKTPDNTADTGNAQDKAPAVQLTEAEQLMALQLDAQMLERKLAEKSGIPAGRMFSKGPLQVAVPFNATYDDVMNLALELMAFAKTQMPLPTEKPVAPAPVVS